jgi:hypothetical protein
MFNILSIVMIHYGTGFLFDNIFFSMSTKMSSKDPDPTVITWPPCSSGPMIQDYGSADSEP